MTGLADDPDRHLTGTGTGPKPRPAIDPLEDLSNGVVLEFAALAADPSHVGDVVMVADTTGKADMGDADGH